MSGAVGQASGAAARASEGGLADANRPAVASQGDRELIRRCLAGERRAFDLLYRAHAPATQRRLARLCGGHLDVEELLQQVFLEAFRSLHRYRADAEFSTWLYRITVNVTMSSLRRSYRRRAEVSLPEDLDQRAADIATPEQLAGERELCREALAHLAALKPMHQVAFVLRHVEGMTMEEIGALVGARAPAVAQRVKKAERLLADRIARQARRGGLS